MTALIHGANAWDLLNTPNLLNAIVVKMASMLGKKNRKLCHRVQNNSRTQIGGSQSK